MPNTNRILCSLSTLNLTPTPYSLYFVAVVTKNKIINIRSCRPSSANFAFSGKRTMSTSSNPVPAKVYYNADVDKESIVEENKGRTGIYR